jgi:large subunit ribosomal protein L18
MPPVAWNRVRAAKDPSSGSRTVNHDKALTRQRLRRQFRVRKRTRGSQERPRLTVTRSHKHMYAQVIDDQAGRTLASASTVDKETLAGLPYGGNKAAAEAVGKAIAAKALAAGIKQVAFDRGSCQYHGRVAALADAARAAGLDF